MTSLQSHRIEVSNPFEGVYLAEVIGIVDGWNISAEGSRPEQAAAHVRAALKARGFNVPTRTAYTA